jgi:hypothetical protein
LLGNEAAAGEIVDERLVDRRAVELEVGDILGKRQPGDRELVFDRSRLLLVDLATIRTYLVGASKYGWQEAESPPAVLRLSTSSYVVVPLREVTA